ncbi:hypothetical protein T12_11066 [Trichinella patagoniensis]|uniref:Uncharacterized protein n=1 Tax=Trichinella patagoniensis TaxID=990121 RepID=A0A0V0ZC52_9BILA|nr:hypothetical protein T12_11066 [Trichinella patagoniensis]
MQFLREPLLLKIQALIGLFPPRNTLANIFAHDGPLVWDDVKMRVEIIPCVLQMKKAFWKREEKKVGVEFETILIH